METTMSPVLGLDDLPGGEIVSGGLLEMHRQFKTKSQSFMGIGFQRSIAEHGFWVRKLKTATI